MYPFRFSVKLLHYILKNISDYSSRRTPAAKSTASAASITFLLKFFQFPSCFRCQICRNFNLYSCIFITVYRRIIHCNDTFASQTYLRSGLFTASFISCSSVTWSTDRFTAIISYIQYLMTGFHFVSSLSFLICCGFHT